MIPRSGFASFLLPVLMIAALSLTSCKTAAPTSKPAQPATPAAPAAVNTINAEPLVRVRLLANESHITLDAAGGLQVGLSPDAMSTIASAITVSQRQGHFIVTPQAGKSVSFKGSGLWVRAASTTPVRVNRQAYPGVIRLEVATGPYAQADRVDVVNHLPMETYLPGVVHAEMYASWQPEAYAAQAIAARSYALFEMGLKTGRTYDLEGSVASQAYAGANAHDQAHHAVRLTRGVILSWQGRVLPAFYSSACGGVNQYAQLVLPHGTAAGPVNAARPECVWCKGSAYYRWGPIARDRNQLSRRIAAWGKASREPVAGLGTLAQISVTQRTPTGRPTRYTLVDTQGQSFVMGAESFRFACNFAAPGMGAVSPAMNLRSSHTRPTVVGNRVLFELGRGFGHGVGMCQWGAQGLAQAGYDTPSILAFYYPGSKLVKTY